jgi:hypothetical protein
MRKLYRLLFSAQIYFISILSVTEWGRFTSSEIDPKWLIILIPWFFLSILGFAVCCRRIQLLVGKINKEDKI